MLQDLSEFAMPERDVQVLRLLPRCSHGIRISHAPDAVLEGGQTLVDVAGFFHAVRAVLCNVPRCLRACEVD